MKSGNVWLLTVIVAALMTLVAYSPKGANSLADVTGPPPPLPAYTIPAGDVTGPPPPLPAYTSPAGDVTGPPPPLPVA